MRTFTVSRGWIVDCEAARAQPPAMTSLTGITLRNVIFDGAVAGATDASTYPDSATFVAAADGRCNLAILFFLSFPQSLFKDETLFFFFFFL